MYSREYGGKKVNFEASGGLMLGSLVMQDKETDSYWSIMSGDAVAGPFAGTELEEIPAGRKMQWMDWVRLHPDTLVLSVQGREDAGRDPYEDYFASDAGFGGLEALDERLPTKEPVFAFRFHGEAYAVPYRESEGGAIFKADGNEFFLFREKGSPIFQSTAAYLIRDGSVELQNEGWTHRPSGTAFDPEKLAFPEIEALEPLPGFDTFWYSWSLVQKDTVILKAK